MKIFGRNAPPSQLLFTSEMYFLELSNIFLSKVNRSHSGHQGKGFHLKSNPAVITKSVVLQSNFTFVPGKEACNICNINEDCETRLIRCIITRVFHNALSLSLHIYAGLGFSNEDNKRKSLTKRGFRLMVNNAPEKLCRILLHTSFSRQAYM